MGRGGGERHCTTHHTRAEGTTHAGKGARTIPPDFHEVLGQCLLVAGAHGFRAGGRVLQERRHWCTRYRDATQRKHTSTA